MITEKDEELGEWYLQPMSNKEILKKYKDLPIRRMKRLDSKYLD